MPLERSITPEILELVQANAEDLAKAWEDKVGVTSREGGLVLQMVSVIERLKEIVYGDLWIVTIKLPPKEEHNPREKKTGVCEVSDHCTDLTGEHHTLIIRSLSDLDAVREKYGHITRIEKARIAE